ncbi:hypothetical protein HDU76_005754, partial [Blyttiomyces sp. JEL0837]
MQSGSGLYTLHPLPDASPSYYNRAFHWWIVYGILVGGWITLFVFSEVIWKTQFKVRGHTLDWVWRSLEKRFGGWGNGNGVVKDGFTLGGVGVGLDGSGEGGWWKNERGSNNGKGKSFGFGKRDFKSESGETEPTVSDAQQPTFGKNITGAPKLTFRKRPGKSGITVVRPSVPTSILDKAAVVKKDAKSESWKVFTWAEIDDALKNGESYVVANGKYVFDINRWTYAHPGGSIVLQQVAGTDVTNDFFNEAGYDASAFVPKKALSRTLSMSNAHRHLPTVPEQFQPQDSSVDVISQRRPPPRLDSKTPTLASSLRAAELLSISENEWKMLVKARRTNVHSKLAVEKLSSLMVGEISQDDNEKNGLLGGGFRYIEQKDDEDNGTGIEFSPMEYRRYGLLDMQLVSDINCQNPVYKQKFCILYPFDTRKNEPTEFLPGQCIEIQMKVKNTIVSRYYTPQSGSPTCFEIHIKLIRDGQMTPHLLRQKVGDRQIKIRGPFGTPLLHLVRVSGDAGVGSNELMPVSFDRVLFVCGGSGLAPLIHYLEWMFLPKHVPLYVIQSYEAAHPDEISVVEGDYVTVSEHLHDGWAMGRNHRTGREGLFPLPITIPRCGLNARIAILNAVRTPQDAFGSKILKSVMLAYPSHVSSVTHCLSRYNNDQSKEALELLTNACPGDIVPGRIKAGVIVDALDKCGWVSEIPLNKKVVLCGPQRFEGDMVDLLGVIRDDPIKLYYEQHVTLKDVVAAVTDSRLWGHLIITMVGLTPLTPISTYLPSIINSFGFNVYVSNALTAPGYILSFISMTLMTYLADKTRERGFHGLLSATWLLIGLIALRFTPDTADKYTLFAVLLVVTVVTTWPMANLTHPLNISWMTENMAPLGKRTVASGAIIGAANIYAVYASQIYRAKDAPRFHTGNSILIGFAIAAIILRFLQKSYYRFLNSKREHIWANFTEAEKQEYLKTTKD